MASHTHPDGTAKLTKFQLAQHLDQRHSDELLWPPFGELRQWSVDDLRKTHAELHARDQQEGATE